MKCLGLILFTLMLFISLPKISRAVYPVAGRKKLSLSGFLFTLFVIFTSLFIALPAYGATINAAIKIW